MRTPGGEVAFVLSRGRFRLQNVILNLIVAGAFVPSIAVYIFFRERIINGLTRGAVKG